MTVTYNPDVSVRPLSRLANVLKEKPVIENLIRVLAEELQEIEYMWFQLLNERGLNEASGEQLNVIGRILNEPRAGKSDEDYLQSLKLKIAINTSTGINSDVRNAVTQLTDSQNVLISDNYPASVDIVIDGTNIGGDILNTIDNIVGAGIGVNINTTLVNPFSMQDFDGVDYVDDPTGFGFSDFDGVTTDDTGAGNLVDKIL